MLVAAHDQTRSIAARQLTVASFQSPELDPEGPALLAADEPTRTAAVGVFANNITHAARATRGVAVVSAALNDPAKAVRAPESAPSTPSASSGSTTTPP